MNLNFSIKIYLFSPWHIISNVSLLLLIRSSCCCRIWCNRPVFSFKYLPLNFSIPLILNNLKMKLKQSSTFHGLNNNLIIRLIIPITCHDLKTLSTFSAIIQLLTQIIEFVHVHYVDYLDCVRLKFCETKKKKLTKNNTELIKRSRQFDFEFCEPLPNFHRWKFSSSLWRTKTNFLPNPVSLKSCWSIFFTYQNLI